MDDTKRKQQSAGDIVLGESNHDEQRMMIKLQQEYYESNEGQLVRSQSMEDMTRSYYTTTSRRKSRNLRQLLDVERRTKQTQQMKTRRKSSGNVGIPSLVSVGPAVEGTTCEGRSQVPSKSTRDMKGKNSMASSRLQVVHEELIARKPRERLYCQMKPSSVAPELQAIAQAIKSNRNRILEAKQHLREVSNDCGVPVEDCFDMEAPLKGGDKSNPQTKRAPRFRGNNTMSPSARNHQCLIPKTSPLARYKRQWKFQNTTCSPDESSDSSIHSLDDSGRSDIFEISSTNDHDSHCVSINSDDFSEMEELDDSCMSERRKHSGSMDLSELALNLASLSTRFDVNDIFVLNGAKGHTNISNGSSSSRSFARSA